ncbi:hydrolase [Streptomyces chrestomyceticus JCM 4735]|uniref:Hydrolase n=1 Tax=Streptomyces chrestomyceticus JCM 4735 TaxID=1306181 RepID=A0A7U9PWI1_9ACTN|nr:trypsin-like serine protease [Streptomyces chrestomyceticus]GCD33415.1 hydrolase [Streptomyces chrestomyceticus JCM 4735]
MHRRIPRPAWLTTVTAAVVAAGALTTAPAQAVAGDPVADQTYAFTAKLDIGDGARSCSGALVDAHWILTAASCFADDPAQPSGVPAGKPTRRTTATVGRTDLTTQAGQVREIVELVPRADRDLALARLDKPVTGITPVALGTSAPTAGEELRATGYGRTRTAWVPDRLHSGAFTVDSAEDGRIGITGKDGAALCKGDTGSPAFREQDGRYQLVAVSSRSWQGGCLGTDEAETRTGAVATRVDDIDEWARTVVRRLVLKSVANGKYVTAEINDTGNQQGKLRARADKIGSWQRFTLTDNTADGTVSLRSEANDLFVSAEIKDAGDHSGMLRTRGATVGSWEKFLLVPQPDGTFALKSKANDKFVSTEVNATDGDYGLLRARSDRAGGWERFTVERVDAMRTAPSAS